MTRTISFTLNGEAVAAEIKPHHNLVELLQREFNLLGARESCGQGMCGCCTVLVNGTAVSGCLYLAAFVDGAEVTTVESLAKRRYTQPGTRSFHRGRRFPMRVLYAGLHTDDHATARRASGSGRRPDSSLPLGQSLPLRRLSGNRQCGQARRTQAQGACLGLRCGQRHPECCRFANLRRRRGAAVGTGRFLTFPPGPRGNCWRLLLRRTAPHSKHAQ